MKRTLFASTVALLSSNEGVHAFQTRKSLTPRRAFEPERTRLPMGIEQISDFYQSYPTESAVLTCGVKASVADCIAQVRSWKDAATGKEGEGGAENSIEIKRNLSYIVYGGIFIGLMCNLEYNCLFPILFGDDTSLITLCKKNFFDNFISAPLMWLPPLYMTKAVMFEYPLEEGLRKYVHDVKEEGLLLKYWSVWVPAQFVTFGLIPEHFRVAFMAMISFCWFIILSTLSSSSKGEEAESQITKALE